VWAEAGAPGTLGGSPFESQQMTDPSFIHVASPLDPSRLSSPDARCRRVQFNERLSAAEHRLVAEFLKANPQLTLRIYGDSISEVPLLTAYEGIAFLQLDMFAAPVQSIIEALPRSLTTLTIVSRQTPAIDITPLKELPALEEVNMLGPTKGVRVLAALPRLRRVSLGKVPPREAAFLHDVAGLDELCLDSSNIQLGDVPSSVRNLRCLRLINLRKMDDREFVTSLATLDRLYLEALPALSRLPSLAQVSNLRDLWVENLRKVHDITPLAHAKSLHRFVCLGMPQLVASDFAAFRDHPALREIYYSSAPFSAAIWGRAGHEVQTEIRLLLELEATNHAAWPSWNDWPVPPSITRRRT
jgi:hypothetical protein